MLVLHEPDLFRLAVTLHTPVAVAWQTLTSPAGVARWWGDGVTLDVAVGGALHEQWHNGERLVSTVGRVVVCQPPHVLAFTWADDDWSLVTGVSWQLREQPGTDAGAPVCELLLEHRGWLALPESCRVECAELHRQRWTTQLERLAALHPPTAP
jgi:uncharacterized protein YndB with AHSA1/START domain